MNANQVSGPVALYDDLQAWPRKFIEFYPPTNVFAVISWGLAATSWLAKALNSHPEIYCVHCGNLFWSILSEAPALDGVKYLRLIASQGYAHRVAGDVHGVSRDAVPELRRAFGDRFRAVVLVREPLARLRSQFALFERILPHRIFNLDYLAPLIDRLGFRIAPEDYRRRLYVHGVNMLNTIIEEVPVGPIFTSESITTDPLAFADLVRAATGDAIEVHDAWCHEVLRISGVNKHNTRSEDPFAQPWLREVVRKVVRPEAWDLYRKLGYASPDWLR